MPKSGVIIGFQVAIDSSKPDSVFKIDSISECCLDCIRNIIDLYRVAQLHIF